MCVCVCLHGMSGHRLEKAARRFACCAKSLKKFERKKKGFSRWRGFTYSSVHRTVYTGRLVRHMFFDYLSLFLSTIIRSTFFSLSLSFSLSVCFSLSLSCRACVLYKRWEGGGEFGCWIHFARFVRARAAAAATTVGEKMRSSLSPLSLSLSCKLCGCWWLFFSLSLSFFLFLI